MRTVKMRAWARGILVALGNLLLFIAANAVALAVPSSALDPIGRFFWGHHWQGLEQIGSTIGVAYLITGAVMGVWTKSPYAVVFPAILSVALVITSISLAMYAADSGDPAIAWRYIVPDKKTSLLFIWVTVAAAGGWAGTRALRGWRITRAGRITTR